MRKIFLFAALLLVLQASAQEKVRITLSDGWTRDIPVENIQEMLYVQTDQANFDIEGEWVWASKKQGLCEAIKFNDDGLLSLNVFMVSDPIPSSTIVGGRYEYADGLLAWLLSTSTSVSKYTVSNTSDTEFTLGAIGSVQENDIYYKVLGTKTVTTNSAAIQIGNSGDEIVYVDDYYVEIKDNKLSGRNVGTGYVIVFDKELNTNVAYKINVERGPVEPIHYESYFKKSADEIKSEFGNYKNYSDSGDFYTWTYYDTDAETYMLNISFDKKTNKVMMVSAKMDDNDCIDAYHNDIKDRYLLDSERSDEVNYYYYDSEDIETRKIRISVDTKNALITYVDFD